MRKRDLYKLVAKYIEDHGFEIYRVDENIKVRLVDNGSLFSFNIGFYNSDVDTMVVHRWVNSWHEVATLSLSDPKCFEKMLDILNGR